MKKLYVFLIGLLLWANVGFGQCGIVYLGSQADIDNFVTNYNCTTVDYLHISGSDVVNLNGLSQLVTINNLEVQNVPNLSDFSGLSGVTTITQNMVIGNTTAPTVVGLMTGLQTVGGGVNISTHTAVYIQGLSALTSVGGDFSLGCNNLTQFNGLGSLSTVLGTFLIIDNTHLNALPTFNSLVGVGMVFLYNNPQITSLNGLNSLQAIGGNLHIYANTALTSVAALSNVNSINGGLYVHNNDALTSLTGLDNGIGINHLDIYNNPVLSVCNNNAVCMAISYGVGTTIYNNAPGCESLTQVSVSCGVPQNCTDVTLSTQAEIDAFALNNGCSSLTGALTISGAGINNLNGLSQLTSIGSLSLYDVPALTDFSGLNNLTTVSGNFQILSATAAALVNVCPNLTTVGGNFDITSTSATSLSGFSSLNSVTGIFGLNYNYSLASINAFGNLATVGSTFAILGNTILSSLPSFSALTNTGTFNVNDNTALTSLNGFPSLAMISGNFACENNPLITSMGGLESLVAVHGYFSMTQNTALTSLSGLQNVNPSWVTGLYFYNNPALEICSVTPVCTAIANGVGTSIYGNAPGCEDVTQINVSCGLPQNCDNVSLNSQAQIDAYAINNGCTSITGQLSISGGDITNLDGLSQITAIGSIQISEAPLLTDFSGLDNVTSVTGNVTIAGTMSATLSNLLPSLTTVGDYISLSGNTATSISGFASVTTIGTGLRLDSMPNLTTLTGFGNLATIGNGTGLGISSNPLLTSLPAFSSLTSIGGDFTVTSNTVLPSISGFNAVTSINGTLNTYQNPALTGITGLQSLTSLNGYIQIFGNDQLSSISGLQNINPATVTYIYLSSNPLLATCNITSLCTYIANGGGSSISGNAVGCENATQISVTCGVSQNCTDITLSSQAQIDAFTVNYGCTSITGTLTINGADVTNLDGLSQLTATGGIYISEAPLLTDFSGLDNVASITGNVTITGTMSGTLSNLFPSLATVGGYISLSGNTATSISGFASVTSIGTGLGLDNMPNLTTLSGFGNLATIGAGTGLGISGNALLTALPVFSNLTSIGGPITFSSNAALASVSGFNNLASIDGVLNIYGNPNAVSISAFQNLTSINGYINVYDNAVLTSISGIGNINPATINYIYLYSNPLLATCDVASVCGYIANGGGTSYITGNAFGCENATQVSVTCGVSQNCTDITLSSQAQIDAFTVNYGCTSITGTLTINGVDVTNLDGLSQLTATGGLYISEAPLLTDFSGLDNVTSITGNVTITGTVSSSLSNLFPSLATVGGYISLSGNTATSISGFASLISTGAGFGIDGNANLVTVSGFGNLATVGSSLGISSNPLLTTYPSFSNLASVNGDLFVIANTALTSVSGFGSLNTVNGSLAIYSNPNAVSISAFQNLTSISGYINMYDNAVLTSISGLGNINPATITYLYLYNNPLLATCNVASVCAYIANGGGTIYIFGNAFGCENATQVLVSCGTPQNCTDITLYSQAQIDAFPVNYGCTSITGTLTINGADVTNLDGLSQLTAAGGIYISEAPLLTDFSGLDNVASVTGNVTITGTMSGTLSNLFPAMTTVGGYVALSGNTATSISGFASLISTGAGFGIEGNANLVTVSGFGNLATVGSSFGISSNPLLTTYPSFSNLTSVNGDLFVIANTALASVSGFGSLSNVNGSLSIYGNTNAVSISAFQNLTSINGYINMYDNAALTIISGLANINPATITYLYLYNNPLLATCNVASVCSYLTNGGAGNYIFGNALGCQNATQVLVSCGTPQNCTDVTLSTQQQIDEYPYNYGCSTITGTLTIYSGSDITNLNGLAQITAVNNLTISDVANLVDFSGLNNVTGITGNLTIQSNTAASITGFPSLTSVGGNFNVTGTTSLISINGFGNLSSVGGQFNLSGNTALANLPDWSSLTTIGGNFSIDNNAALASLGNLNNINSINGGLSINNNPSLTNVTALASLTTINGAIYIAYNDSLTSLSGLDNINPTTIDYITIYGSTPLAVCNVPSVCNFLANGGSNNIAANAIGCQSATEIIDVCTGIVYNWYADGDGDTYGNLAVTTTTSTNNPPVGYVANSTDCDDTDTTVYQMASFYIDADDDNFDNGTAMVCSGASVPAGYKNFTYGTDCNDAQLQYQDNDGDGAGSMVLVGCGVTNNTDCNDSNPSPSACADLLFVSDASWTNVVSPSPYVCGANVGLVAGYPATNVWGLSLPDTTISKSFNYTITPGYRVVMDGTVDDDVTIVLNGQQVYVDADNFATTFPQQDLTPFLVDGNNVLTVTLHDNGGCASFITAVYRVAENLVTPTFNPIAPICYGDTAPVLPTVSTNGISGTWNPAVVSNTASGTYTFTPNAGQNATTATLSVTVNQLIQYYVDADGDGYDNGVANLCDVAAPVGYATTTLGPDCNDANSNAHAYITWYIDADQDGYDVGFTVVCEDYVLQPGFSLTTLGTDCDDNDASAYQYLGYYVDADGDGYDNGYVLICAGFTAPAGYSDTTLGSDCDDANANVFQNVTYYIDADGDGYDNGSTVLCSGASVPVGYSATTLGSDCDDANANIFQIVTYYIDADGDGYDNGSTVLCSGASVPVGYSATTLGSDCDDANANAFQNVTYYIDADGDGYDNGSTVLCSGASVPVGYSATTLGSDCDDANANVFQNVTYYIDADGDGYDNGSTVLCSGASVPVGYAATTLGSDCDDANANIFQIVTYYIDADGDGYDNGTALLCSGGSVPVGYSATTLGLDCDDANANIFQIVTYYIDADGDGYDNGTALLCSGGSVPVGYSATTLGFDCDDANANAFQTVTYYVDADGDGYDAGSAVFCSGSQVPAGYSLTTLGEDCNDNNASVQSGYPFYADNDGDGYGAGIPVILCAQNANTAPAGFSANANDCNDNIFAINPGVPEILYDGTDNNCDGNLDEGNQITTSLLSSVCNTTLSSLGAVIGIQTLAPQSFYTGWRIRAVNGAQVQVIERNVPHFSMTDFPSYAYATTYTIAVELQRNGVWLGYYGPTCLVSTPAILAPGGPAAISPSQCGITLAKINTLIATTSIAGVTGYRFRVTNLTDTQGPNAVQTLDRTLNWFSLQMLTRYNYGTTYRIEVSVKTTGDYGNYGSACEVSSPIVPSLVNCSGVVTSNTATIATTSLTGATGYRFQVTRQSDGALATIDRSQNWFNFNMVPAAVYTPGALYGVRIAVMTAGTWSPFGDACQITAPGGTSKGIVSVAEAPTTLFKATGHPNPFSTAFNIAVQSSNTKHIALKVYDMLGRLVETQTAEISQIDQLELGQHYPAGVYQVIVSQGDDLQTLRMVKR